MNKTTETPMADHLRQFWQLLAEGKVRVLIDTFHPEGFGGEGHWSSSSFPDDVAKALVAEHKRLFECQVKARIFDENMALERDNCE